METKNFSCDERNQLLFIVCFTLGQGSCGLSLHIHHGGSGSTPGWSM